MATNQPAPYIAVPKSTQTIVMATAEPNAEKRYRPLPTNAEIMTSPKRQKSIAAQSGYSFRRRLRVPLPAVESSNSTKSSSLLELPRIEIKPADRRHVAPPTVRCVFVHCNQAIAIQRMAVPATTTRINTPTLASKHREGHPKQLNRL